MDIRVTSHSGNIQLNGKWCCSHNVVSFGEGHRYCHNTPLAALRDHYGSLPNNSEYITNALGAL